MVKKKKQDDFEGNGFRNLLFFLMLYLVASPFLAPYKSFSVLVHVSLTMTLFFTVYTVESRQSKRSIAMALLIPLLVLYWLGIYDFIGFSNLGASAFFILYYGLLCYSYFQQISQAKRVTKKVVFAALCFYLIIGLFWGSLYSLLNELIPGAYGGTLLADSVGNSVHIFNYFSIVTLTTLGYGDITPQTIGAASLCQLEAIVGQFFTAVLVAWLMGMYIQDKRDEIVTSQGEAKEEG